VVGFAPAIPLLGRSQADHRARRKSTRDVRYDHTTPFFGKTCALDISNGGGKIPERRRNVAHDRPQRNESRSNSFPGVSAQAMWPLFLTRYMIQNFNQQTGKTNMQQSTRTYSRRAAATSILGAAAVGLAAAKMANAEPQPHMQAALRALQSAAGSLEKAADDKGGHRVKAIRLVNEAMDQVQHGIEAANR
jgi:hypothetical protein